MSLSHHRCLPAPVPGDGSDSPASRSGRRRQSRGGQAAVFILMALVILLFAALWSADVHRIIFIKDRSQQAGDASALAAARWQASSLNLLGELNLMQALALIGGDTDAVDLITNTQARLAFTGPMTGMAAAQQAAKLNRIYANPDFTDLVREHAATVRNTYTRRFGGEMLFPEPYPGAWGEYAAMLDAIADDGVAAGADNARFYTDHAGGHVLLDPGFYDAIAGRNWCWFYLNAPGLLESYTGYTWWPALPEIAFQHFQNSELFGLGVRLQAQPLARLATLDAVRQAAEGIGMPLPEPSEETAGWERRPFVWALYEGGVWGRWDAMDRSFPVTGQVLPEYDYRGADAVIRVLSSVDRLTPGGRGDGHQRDAITWTAAAKPFGHLDQSDGPQQRPTRFGLVLPAFREVRLIPVDASSGAGGGSFDLAWRRHIVEHLPAYMARGTSACRSDCWYCARLVTWEDSAFRQTGVSWLRINSDLCIIRPVGGGRPGGGTRRAH